MNVSTTCVCRKYKYNDAIMAIQSIFVLLLIGQYCFYMVRKVILLENTTVTNADFDCSVFILHGIHSNGDSCQN